MNRHNGDNIGGFHTLYIAKVKNLTSDSFDVQKFQNIYLTPQTGKWDRKMKESKNDVYFEHNLIFEAPKFRLEVENYISEVNEVALIAYIVLVNGNFVRIGSLTSPLFITADFESGKNYADFNSYAFKGTATEAISMKKNSAIVITPPIVTPPKGLNFNGLNNYVLVGNAGVANFFNSPNITVDFTVKSNDASADYKAIICKEFDYGVFDYGGTIQVYDWTIGAFGALINSGITTNTKKRITVVFDNIVIGGTCTFYENGIFVNSFPYKNNNFLSNLFIGSNNPPIYGQSINGQFFNGNIQSFSLWNKVLTPKEIVTPNTVRTNLLRQFNFDDGQGFLLKDTSVFGVNAILNNYNLANTTIGTANSWTFENGTPYTG